METKISPSKKGCDRENRRQCVGKDMHIGRAQIIVVAMVMIVTGVMMIVLWVRMFVMVMVVMVIGTSHQQ